MLVRVNRHNFESDGVAVFGNSELPVHYDRQSDTGLKSTAINIGCFPFEKHTSQKLNILELEKYTIFFVYQGESC